MNTQIVRRLYVVELSFVWNKKLHYTCKDLDFFAIAINSSLSFFHHNVILSLLPLVFPSFRLNITVSRRQAGKRYDKKCATRFLVKVSAPSGKKRRQKSGRCEQSSKLMKCYEQYEQYVYDRKWNGALE